MNLFFAPRSYPSEKQKPILLENRLHEVQDVYGKRKINSHPSVRLPHYIRKGTGLQ